jgi:hypothetical protein
VSRRQQHVPSQNGELSISTSRNTTKHDIPKFSWISPAQRCARHVAMLRHAARAYLRVDVRVVAWLRHVVTQDNEWRKGVRVSCRVQRRHSQKGIRVSRRNPRQRTAKGHEGCHVVSSDVQGPAQLKSPGPGSASVSPGFELQRAGPLAPAQGWLGLSSASGHGFTKAVAYFLCQGF